MRQVEISLRLVKEYPCIGSNVYHLDLSCSATIFARKLAELLTPFKKKNWLRNYLYDIIVYAPSYEELFERVDQLFTHMRSVGIG